MKSPTRTITTLIGGAALLLATAGIGVAQETTPDPASQTRAQMGDVTGQAQGARNQTESARRLGPGDGTGNQRIKPADGSGNGSPGRTVAGSTAKNTEATASMSSKAARKAAGKAARKATKTAAGNGGNGAGGNGTRTRSQSRDLSGSGSGTCAGRPTGSQRRAGGSGGGARR